MNMGCCMDICTVNIALCLVINYIDNAQRKACHIMCKLLDSMTNANGIDVI